MEVLILCLISYCIYCCSIWEFLYLGYIEYLSWFIFIVVSRWFDGWWRWGDFYWWYYRENGREVWGSLELIKMFVFDYILGMKEFEIINRI